MSNVYPTSLNNYPTGVNSPTLSNMGHVSEHNALEAKVGVDGSAVVTSLDYLLKNTSSVNPGHHHNNTSLDAIASSKVTGLPTFPSGAIVGTTDTQVLTNKDLSDPSNTITVASVKLPDGYMLNGKIVPSVASNNLTVALKTLAGTDASASDPITIRIADTLRTVTSALSVVMNAGSNWCSAGSSGTATYEMDFFVYLVYETGAQAGVKIGISRIPYGRVHGDFNASATNEKGMPWSGTNVVATDDCVVIGRFAATLSAGINFNWSVPSFTTANLIQDPVYETRQLSALPLAAGFASTTTQLMQYQVSNRRLNFQILIRGTSNSTSFSATLPFTCVTTLDSTEGVNGFSKDNGSVLTGSRWFITPTSNTLTFSKDWVSGTSWTNANGKEVGNEGFIYI